MNRSWIRHSLLLLLVSISLSLAPLTWAPSAHADILQDDDQIVADASQQQDNGLKLPSLCTIKGWLKNRPADAQKDIQETNKLIRQYQQKLKKDQQALQVAKKTGANSESITVAQQTVDNDQAWIDVYHIRIMADQGSARVGPLAGKAMTAVQQSLQPQTNKNCPSHKSELASPDQIASGDDEQDPTDLAATFLDDSEYYNFPEDWTQDQ